ncbi:pimeloyl-ACP methyl ester carboxylesterase [Streptococcus rupicaprae]|uniref:Pimeloyl-ACP methyl ester carboxylesterase n=1 Tax=Streptococcus rupicaprae TaxID=759619 RepID=A0ABV2FEK7_9STRE
MKHYYFLTGGGANRFDAADLVHFLGKEVSVIELPGHGLEREQIVSSLEELKDWFTGKIDATSDGVLIAHSMGANLAPYLAKTCPSITSLILLDGGYYDFDQILPLEEEVIETQSYFDQMVFERQEDYRNLLKENAPYWSDHLEAAAKESLRLENSRYCLNINQTSFFHLLRLQRECQGTLADLTCQTLLIPQTLDCPAWKTNMLQAVPSPIVIDRQIQCGHSPHTEKPEQTAQVILDFLEAPI